MRLPRLPSRQSRMVELTGMFQTQQLVPPHSATCSPAPPTRSGPRVCLLPDAQTSTTAGQWMPTVAIMRHCQKGLRRKPVLRTLLLLFVASVAASLWLSLQAVRAKNGVAVGRQRHISSTPSPLAQSGVAKRELWPQYPTLELREDAYYVHDPRWMVLPAGVHVPSAEAVAARGWAYRAV